jgi:hypothetical protein
MKRHEKERYLWTKDETTMLTWGRGKPQSQC